MLLSITLAPEKTKTGTVANLDELKRQLNIPVEFTDDDPILTDLLAVAIETVEDDTHSDILDTANILEHRLNIDGNTGRLAKLIYIYQAPVKTVDKIETTTNGQDWTELPAAKYGYQVKFNRVEINIFETIDAQAVRFSFKSGFADAKRPVRLKQAVILKAADMFDPERSNYVVGAPVVDNNVYVRLISKHVRTYW